jgi:SAM-dependent MidA family methyltransferase
MNEPAEIIRREIENRGVMSFVRFMELALYYPNGGYYETKINPGRRGDFYTSVNTGELFGRLLAFQFAKWLDELVLNRAQNLPLKLVEAGAHDGRLAGDILGWLQIHRPKLFEEIEYAILEPSARRQESQRETLGGFVPQIRWYSTPRELGENICGIVFSNELLDAMPLHRYGWNAKSKSWFEWGVTVEKEKFAWKPMEKPVEASKFTIHVPKELLDVLPDGYTVECSPAAENWWREMANSLAHGRLLTFDYGLAEDELFSPARVQGTLRAYFQHHVADDILANPGKQDITAHVNFPAIRKAGEEAGLKMEFFGTQGKYLTQILAESGEELSIGKWSAKQKLQFQTLTHPEHLGRAFKVLEQRR